MLKWARRIFVFLLLGAVVNFVVAWGCALRTVRTTNYYIHNPRSENPLVLSVTERLGFRLVSGVERSGTMLSRHPDEVKMYSGRVWWPREATPQGTEIAYAVASGWPILTLRAWRTTDWAYLEGDAGVKWSAMYYHCLHFEHRLFGSRPPDRDDEGFPVHVMLPLDPIWAGVAGNSMLYAAVLALLVAGCARLRRAVQTRRGLCPACGYPRGSSPVCTECGEALPC